MTIRSQIVTGTAALALLATPLSATAQSQGGTAELPSEIAGLDLTNITDETDNDGEREIRGFLPDGYRFEVEYHASGQIDEMKTERASAIPQSLLDEVLPAEVVDAITSQGMMDSVYEIDFDHDDMEVEVEGTAEDSRIEATFSMSGQMIDFEREMTGPSDRGDFDLSQSEVQSLAERAGYTEIGSVSYEDERATFDATNPNGEPVTVSMDDDGEVTREAAR